MKMTKEEKALERFERSAIRLFQNLHTYLDEEIEALKDDIYVERRIRKGLPPREGPPPKPEESGPPPIDLRERIAALRARRDRERAKPTGKKSGKALAKTLKKT